MARVNPPDYSLLFRASPTPMLVIAPDPPRFTILEANDAYLAATMSSRSQLIGRSVFDAFPDNPADTKASGVINLRTSLERVVSFRRPDAMPRQKYDIPHPDGGFHERWWAPVNQPILGADGTVVAIAHHAVDATEQERAERARRASDERHRLILESALDFAIFTMDSDGIITDWPPGAQAVFGGSPEEMVGQDVARTFVPKDREQRAPEHERVEARRTGRAADVRWHQRIDGSRVFIEGVVRRLRNPDGEVIGFLKIGRDASDQWRIEEALRKSRERLRTLIEGIPQLVWRSADGGCWKWSSAQWQVFTGQDESQSLGHGWLDVVHPDDRKRAMDAWETAPRTGILDVELRLRHSATGRYVWHHTRSLPLRDGTGAITEWLGTSTDVQQLKELQEQQAVMVAELQHRTRNLIAVVRSIAAQTMAASGSLDAFRAQFNDRLAALARVQGLLSRSDESPITLEALVRMELDALGLANDAAERVELQGPRVRIRHSVVQTLALALHELATNARKYGALSNDDGRLSIRWRIRDSGDEERRLILEWIEQGLGRASECPPVVGRGYGRELIERALPYVLKARTRYEIDESGVRCTVDMPLTPNRPSRPAP